MPLRDIGEGAFFSSPSLFFFGTGSLVSLATSEKSEINNNKDRHYK